MSATATASSLLPKDCRGVQVVDTALKGFEGEPIATIGGQTIRPWREDWTVTGCGGFAVLSVHFVPVKTGTGMRVPSGEGRKIEPPPSR